MPKEVKNSKRKAFFPPACGCKSYLDHWERATGLTRPDNCSKSGCTNPVHVGAHVFNCSGTSRNTLKIVPLCNTCNNPVNEDCFPLVLSARTPSASKLASCKSKSTSK